MHTDRIFNRLGPIECALHQIDDLKRFIEIDVRPAGVADATVIAALFPSGKLPPGVEIETDLRIGEDRFRFDFSKSKARVMWAAIRQPFKRYFYEVVWLHTVNRFKHGWRHRLARERQVQVRRMELERAWRGRPHPLLGGRSPDEILKRGTGPLEISKVGFVWVGVDPVTGPRTGLQIQTYPYSGDEDFDNSLRWFMQRGTSLNQALRLNSEHMGELNRQALVGSIEVLLGALKTMPGKGVPVTMLDKVLKTSGQVDMTLSATAKAVKRSAAGAHVTGSTMGIEGKVQALGKMEPMAIPVL
ncbi:MAG: hypothetical protein HKO98_10450 [Gemmatimonadetes bacterium]|nr:hypothetical protein [Gemmatimonadota bacterium]